MESPVQAVDHFCDDGDSSRSRSDNLRRVGCFFFDGFTADSQSERANGSKFCRATCDKDFNPSRSVACSSLILCAFTGTMDAGVAASARPNPRLRTGFDLVSDGLPACGKLVASLF